MQYREIILVGVDLTNCGYFFLPAGVNDPDNERRGIKVTDQHATAGRMLKLLPRWATYLRERDTELRVYSPKSALAASLELFKW